MSRMVTPHLVSGEEGTLVNLGLVMGLESSVFKSPTVEEKFVQAFVLLTNKKMSEKMELDEVIIFADNGDSSSLVDRARKMKDVAVIQEVIISYIRDEMTTTQRMAKDLENRVAELKLTIDEFKASEEYKEPMEAMAFSYFGEWVNQCKKQLNLLFPDLDIDDLQIDLVDGDEDEVDEGKVTVQGATFPIHS
ncbi:hypothetical protein Acr_26g0000490 [Actinidia rufa]|uniref:Uncharacterized protein n=1 Tax=Actinidia rufa TaxID=165716 RepID=A0A7J0H114_9ERIC|nr:hypothetical protein Acr_26g0000490 [Actinidia rufa]